MLHWKVNLFEELRAAGWYPHKIRQNKLFGESTVQKMRHQKLVSWAEFDRLCGVLNKQPGDLLEWVSDEKEDGQVEEREDPSEWYKPNDKGH